MYCPDCGAKTSLDVKFCRSCGLGLEKIAQSLVEQLPRQADDALQARKNKLERVGRFARNVFLLATLSFFLFVIGYLLTQGNIIGALVLFGVLVFVGCGLLPLFLWEKAKELEKVSSIRQLQRPGGLMQNGATGKLLSAEQIEPPLSVTERTTELLSVEKQGGGHVS